MLDYLHKSLVLTSINISILLVLITPNSLTAAPLDLATIPLSNSPTVPIQSNLLFIFDDSGSMADDSMPDAHNSNTIDLFRNASYNTIYYNPAITYLPPANFTASGLNTTAYPSQTGISNATGANGDTKPNWKNVARDAYGVLSTINDDLTNNAYFFTTLAGEFCTKGDLKDCAVQSAPSIARPFPAPVRWCNNATNANLATSPPVNACQATNTTGFTNLRRPTPRTALINLTGASSNPIFEGISISGQQIMSSDTPGNTNNVTAIAQAVVDRINSCTYGTTGSCGIAGYSATSTSGAITIYAPAGSTTTVTPSVQVSGGTLNGTVGAFSKNSVPGQTLYTAINNPSASYNFPSTNTKAAGRTDCGSTCTYAQEMTNYANWYTYYRTRAQMMKTSTSLAFKDIGDDFRVGFMATSTLAARSLNFARFNTTQKNLWYAKLFSTPSDRNTPLRGALSKAGRIYANNTAAKRGIFTDPVEYECQQNFTLLTTDGFWNTADETDTYAGGPRNVNDSGDVGNRDASPTPLGMREGSGALATSNSLADVAKYYRDTDLRTTALSNCNGALGQGVCETSSTEASPPNQKQTMVTLTMGLGVDGLLTYINDYENLPGDYKDIEAGNKNWPRPAEGTITAVDDLWHAAVNGGGTYFSAKNPLDVVSQLKQAIASILVKTGTGSAAAASTLSPVGGDNFSYVGSYVTSEWTGNLEKRTIDTTTGAVSLSATHCVEDIIARDSCATPSVVRPDGSGGYNCETTGVTDANSCTGTIEGTTCKVKVNVACQGKLKDKVSAFTSSARNIKMNVGGILQDFAYANLTAAQQQYFDKSWLTANLTQWPTFSAEQQLNVTGDNLVRYLRGETGFDFNSATLNNKLFRNRQATLGDLVHATPKFTAQPRLLYGDPGYQEFKSAQAGRAKVVYIGANDGMLHAFRADDLTELWAYVPTMVIPNLWKLADSNYSAKHTYFLDGVIETTDICTANCDIASATWKTILVAGLGAGGRGYIALDVTNPSNPSLMWEFDAKNSTLKGDPNLGFTFGNPIVTKRNIDGKWVVLFTSGYNNISDNSTFYSTSQSFKPNNPAIYTTGNGGGYLYLLDAATGNRLQSIPTLDSTGVNVGNTVTPSGLAKITSLELNSDVNKNTTYIYGGDLLGNLWRFNINTAVAVKLAELKAGSTPQPITSKPEIGLVNGKTVLFVGTGKYLEVADLTNQDKQTIYAIKDEFTNVALVNPRTTLVQQSIVTVNGDSRKSAPINPVNFTTGRGWFVDLPDVRERINVDPQLVLGTLLFPSLVSVSTACQPAGYGWFNYFDYKTGGAVNLASGLVSQRLNAPSAGFSVINVNGKPVVNNSGVNTTNQEKIDDIPFNDTATGFKRKRSIWREIAD